MDGVVELLREQRNALVDLESQTQQVVARILEAARELNPQDREAAEVLLEIAELVGRREQSGQGQLLLLLAQADRIKAARGGVKAWAATHLDVTDGRSREIAQAARRIATVPELEEPLASGQLGTGTVSVLSRTANAIKGTTRDKTATLTAMLDTARTEGITEARKQVRVLEHSLDPDSGAEIITKQRARSFFRMIELEDGLCRFEILLDVLRATTVRTAIDQQAADLIRQAQFDGTPSLPDDVQTTEQINAQALVRIAEVFLTAPPKLRQAKFTSTTVLFAPSIPSDKDPLAETVYGSFVPRTAIDPSAVRVMELDEDGMPIAIDGVKIDTDPHARHASRDQRTALAYRDRHCTYPGCTRPSTWSLHAHHQVPHSKGGPTVMRNLALLCSEHHTLTHQDEQDGDEQ